MDEFSFLRCCRQANRLANTHGNAWGVVVSTTGICDVLPVGGPRDGFKVVALIYPQRIKMGTGATILKNNQ